MLTRSIVTTLIAAACMLTSSFATAAPLQAFKAEYEVSRNGSALGSGTIALVEQGPGRWEFATHSTGEKGLAGLVGVEVRERSSFIWVGDQPRLLDYEFKQDAAWKSKSRRIRIDARSGVVFSDWDNDSKELGHHPNVVDRNLASVSVMAGLAKGLSDIEVPIVDKDRLDTRRYRVTGDERVSTPAGVFTATRVERVRSTNERTTISWFSKAHGYLPIKLEQREKDGETMVMLLKRLPD